VDEAVLYCVARTIYATKIPRISTKIKFRLDSRNTCALPDSRMLYPSGRTSLAISWAFFNASSWEVPLAGLAKMLIERWRLKR